MEALPGKTAAGAGKSTATTSLLFLISTFLVLLAPLLLAFHGYGDGDYCTEEAARSLAAPPAAATADADGAGRGEIAVETVLMRLLAEAVLATAVPLRTDGKEAFLVLASLQSSAPPIELAAVDNEVAADAKEKPGKAKAMGQGGIPFDKSMGWHNLKIPALVDSIIAKNGLKSTDIVLQFGSAASLHDYPRRRCSSPSLLPTGGDFSLAVFATWWVPQRSLHLRVQHAVHVSFPGSDARTRAPSTTRGVVLLIVLIINLEPSHGVHPLSFFFFFYFPTVWPRLQRFSAALKQEDPVHHGVTSTGADLTTSPPPGIRH